MGFTYSIAADAGEMGVMVGCRVGDFIRGFVQISYVNWQTGESSLEVEGQYDKNGKLYGFSGDQDQCADRFYCWPLFNRFNNRHMGYSLSLGAFLSSINPQKQEITTLRSKLILCRACGFTEHKNPGQDTDHFCNN